MVKGKLKLKQIVFYSALFIVGGAAIFDIGSSVYKFIQIREEVNKLPIINDPKTFISEFEISESKPVEEIKWVGEYKSEFPVSSYYPFTELRRQYIRGDNGCRYRGRTLISEEARYSLIDSFWNIFWVEIDKCEERVKYFGPYKLPKELSS